MNLNRAKGIFAILISTATLLFAYAVFAEGLVDPIATTNPLVIQDAADEPEQSERIEMGTIEGLSVTPDVILVALVSGNVGAFYTAMRKECPVGCGDRLDATDAMHAAATVGDVGMMQILVEEGGNLNDRAEASGWTPLLAALYAMNNDMVRYLVDAGVDTTIAGQDGTTAAFLADLAGLDDLIPYPALTMSEADANMLLLRAIEAGSVPYVELALASGAKASTQAENGWSALMIAAFRGEVEAARRLIASDKGIVGYAEPKGGLNAAHAALIGLIDPADRETLVALLRSLAEAGLDLKLKTSAGISPLEIAKNQKHGAAIEQLVSTLADGKIPVTPQPETLPDDPAIVIDTALSLRSGYLTRNANLRSGPSANLPVIETMLLGDQVEVLERLQDGWVRIKAETGSYGFTREEFVSDDIIDKTQFGAVCVDGTFPFTIIDKTHGLPNPASAIKELDRLVDLENCDAVVELSGEKCYAMAYSGLTFESSTHYSAAIVENVNLKSTIPDLQEKCQSRGNAPCQGSFLWCAKPKRNN